MCGMMLVGRLLLLLLMVRLRAMCVWGLVGDALVCETVISG